MLPGTPRRLEAPATEIRMRVYCTPRWIQPSEQGVEIGALATGEGDITDVGDDVSARHAHIWCDAQNIWHVEDLSSTNGTVVVNGATRVCIQVEPGRSAQLNPGDELKLGESTTYAILFGKYRRAVKVYLG